MVSRHDLDSVVFQPFPPEFRYARHAHEIFQRNRSEKDDGFRGDEFDLPFQERNTCRRLRIIIITDAGCRRRDIDVKS